MLYIKIFVMAVLLATTVLLSPANAQGISIGRGSGSPPLNGMDEERTVRRSPWNSLTSAPEGGRLVAITGMSRVPEREKHTLFTNSCDKSRLNFADPAIPSLKHLYSQLPHHVTIKTVPTTMVGFNLFGVSCYDTLSLDSLTPSGLLQASRRTQYDFIRASLSAEQTCTKADGSINKNQPCADRLNKAIDTITLNCVYTKRNSRDFPFSKHCPTHGTTA
jgi:hypothetical protein